MQTISVSELKTHLSRELKRVRKGARLVVTDHSHPVAIVMPYEEEEPIFDPPLRKTPPKEVKIKHGLKFEGDPLDFLYQDRKR